MNWDLKHSEDGGTYILGGPKFGGEPRTPVGPRKFDLLEIFFLIYFEGATTLSPFGGYATAKVSERSENVRKI